LTRHVCAPPRAEGAKAMPPTVAMIETIVLGVLMSGCSWMGPVVPHRL
jgi:hypothetical protein